MKLFLEKTKNEKNIFPKSKKKFGTKNFQKTKNKKILFFPKSKK